MVVKEKDMTFHGVTSHESFVTRPQSGEAAGGLVAWQRRT